MMITFLGSLLGFVGSAFPEFLKVYRDNKDREHELLIMDRQMKMMQMGHQSRLDEVQINADSSVARALYNHAKPTGVLWVDAMAGTVRPLLTYAFFMLYASMKFCQWKLALEMLGADGWAEAMLNVWHIEDQALFATVVSFWFGQRMLHKVNQGMKS